MIDIHKKGYTHENKLVHIFKDFGFDAHRNLMSGAIEGWKGDIQLKFGTYKFNIEAKHWKSMAIFRIWDKHRKETTGAVPLLAIKEDGNDTLVCMELKQFAQMMQMLIEHEETVLKTDLNPYMRGDTATKGKTASEYNETKDLIDDIEKLIRKYKYKK